jgi:hypothetical protein
LNSKNVLTASYVGNNCRKLLYSDYYSSKSAINLDFASGIGLTTNAGQSSYNSLQVQDRGRLLEGLDLVGSFTYAHALDNESNDAVGTGRYPLYGNADNDLRRVLNVALNYEAPGLGANHLAHALTSGWILANRFAAQSGNPLTLIQGTFYQNDGSEANYYPNLVPGVPIYLHGSAAQYNNGSGQTVPAPDGWMLNPSAFSKVPLSGGVPEEQGTLGRNFLRTPAFWAWNTSMQRSFPIYEQLHMNSRVDAFNILNHPNLDVIDPILSDTTFGTSVSQGAIGSTDALYAMGAARSLQLSLKLQF